MTTKYHARRRTIIQLLWRTWQRTREADVAFLAGSLAFTTVISIVPLLAVSLSIFKAYGGLDSLFKIIEPFILQDFVDASGVHLSEFIRKAIHRIQAGVLGVGGSIVLFFTSTKLFLDLERAVRRVWREPVTSPSLGKLLIYWILLFFGPLGVAALLGALGSKDLALIQNIPRHTIGFAITLIGLFCVNWFLPIQKVSFRAAISSGIVTTIGITLAQQFYGQITKHMLRYGKIYGSLASIPIFLIWVLLLWWIFFAGVALCATIEEPAPGTAPRARTPRRRSTDR